MDLRKEKANEMIKSLRESYEVFDKSLQQSDDYHHRDVFKAYLQEAKYGTSGYSEQFTVNDIDHNEEASKLNQLIVKSLRGGSANYTKSKVETLSLLFETKKWSELSKQIGIFEDAIAEINVEAFKKSPNIEVYRVCELKEIELVNRFKLYLNLKIIGIIVATKNVKFPLTYEVIVVGIMSNRSIIGKSTFNKTIKEVDEENPSELTKNILEAILEEEVQSLLNLASEYRLDNYNSKYLNDADELALSVRKFDGMDYVAIADLAEISLNLCDFGHSTHVISEEKVIIFLAVADSYTKQQYFKDIESFGSYKNTSGDDFFVNSRFISKYIGDVKVVRAIKDSLLFHGILRVKSKYLPEVRKTTYELLIDLEDYSLYVIKVPILLSKINNMFEISYTSSIDEKLSMLHEVMDVATNLKYNIDSSNFLEIYIESSMYGVILEFINLGQALKMVVSKNDNSRIPRYYNAVSELKKKDAKKIYVKIYYMVNTVISDLIKYGETSLYLPTFHDNREFNNIKKFNKALLKMIKK